MDQLKRSKKTTKPKSFPQKYAQEIDEAHRAFDKEYVSYEPEGGYHTLLLEDKNIPKEVAWKIWEQVILKNLWTVEQTERLAAGVNPADELLPSREMNVLQKQIQRLDNRLFRGTRAKTGEEREHDKEMYDKARQQMDDAQRTFDLFMRDPSQFSPGTTKRDLGELVRLSTISTQHYSEILSDKMVSYNNVERTNMVAQRDALQVKYDILAEQRGKDAKKIVRQRAGIPELAVVLAHSDRLWKHWWFTDFPRFENDLHIEFRGLPWWIIDQELPPLPSDQDTDEVKSEYQVYQQYEHVPWRRFYAWCKFFERRCAKMVATNALMRAQLFNPPPVVPIGVVPREPIKVVRWQVGAGRNVYLTNMDWEGDNEDENNKNPMLLRQASLEVAAFQIPPRHVHEGTKGSPYMAFEILKTNHYAEHPEDDLLGLCTLIGNSPALRDHSDDLKRVPLTFNFLETSIYAPDDVIFGNEQVEAMDNRTRFGIIMLSFIVWYNNLERSPLDPAEFEKWSAQHHVQVLYETYQNDFFRERDDRDQSYQENVDALFITSLFWEVEPLMLATSETDLWWALRTLPVVPLRGEEPSESSWVTAVPGQKRRIDRVKGAGGVRFLGDACRVCNEPGELLQCKQCKGALYCSRECQAKDWTHGGHKEACNPKEN